MTASISPKAAEGRLSGRIGPTHLERLAIVYVRQCNRSRPAGEDATD
jgi:hypothetical protein